MSSKTLVDNNKLLRPEGVMPVQSFLTMLCKRHELKAHCSGSWLSWILLGSSGLRRTGSVVIRYRKGVLYNQTFHIFLIVIALRCTWLIGIASSIFTTMKRTADSVVLDDWGGRHSVMGFMKWWGGLSRHFSVVSNLFLYLPHHYALKSQNRHAPLACMPRDDCTFTRKGRCAEVNEHIIYIAH